MLLPPDAELVRRDTKIKGLRFLFDPKAFAELLRSRLPEINLKTALITYVRYKPGTNCLVLYRLQAAGEEFSVYAKAYGRGAADKLEKARKRPAVESSFGPGRLFFDDEGIVISFFPNDVSIKTLVKLGNTDSRKRVLRRLAPDQIALWNASLRELRYKPERRFVAQLLFGAEPKAVLKFYTAGDYRQALAGARAFNSGELLTLPRLIGRSERRRALAFEWLDGKVLSDAFAEENFKPEKIELVGAGLAELHAQQATGLIHLTRAAEANSLRAVANDIGSICPNLAKSARALAGRLAAMLMSEPERKYPIHGDFYAQQALLCGDQVAILDFDRSCYGDPAADLGNFTAHLERDLQRGEITTERAELLRNALICGYKKSEPAIRSAHRQIEEQNIELYTAVGLFRLAPFPFRDHEDDWANGIEKILSRAKEIAARLEKTSLNIGLTTNKDWQIPPIHKSPGSEVLVTDPFGVANDEKMPFLARALEPSEVKTLFAPHLRSLLGSEAVFRLLAIRAVRHKPGRRAVIEYDLEAKRSNSKTETLTIVGKARSKGLDETSFQIQRSLWLSNFNDASSDGISVPEPIAAIPELRMWMQRYVPGTVISSLLTGSEGVDLARRIAKAIYKLHQMPLPQPAKARRSHTIFEELEILRNRLNAVAGMKPNWQERIKFVLAASEKLGETLTNDDQATIHRDFYGDQIIVSGERLFLIDFDLLCAGDPALDVGNFIGHITEQSLRAYGDPTTLKDREQALEDAYAELAGEQLRNRVRAYATLTLARHIYISTLFADRRMFTEKLLELCEDRLGIRHERFNNKQAAA